MRPTIFVCAVVMAAPVHAAPDAAARGVANYCSAQGELAHVVMKRRQDGVRMAEQIESAHQVPDPVVSKAYELLVRIAYLEDRAATESGRTRAAEDFENDVYSNCFEQMTPAS